MRVFPLSGGPRRAHRQKIYQWLAEHPELWQGKEFKPYSMEWRDLATRLKTEGLYSKTTFVGDIKVPLLIEGAKNWRPDQ